MKMRTDVVFYCWRCGQKVSVPDVMQGKLLPCPGCERLLTVPEGADVPKRMVPVVVPEEIVVTDNDVTFDCVHCDWLLVADKRGAGMTLQCPGCGKLVTVPSASKVPLDDVTLPEQTDPGSGRNAQVYAGQHVLGTTGGGQESQSVRLDGSRGSFVGIHRNSPPFMVHRRRYQNRHGTTIPS